MKKRTLLSILVLVALLAHAQQPTRLKTGVYKDYDDFADNDPKSTELPQLKRFVRINRLDPKYSDTLFQLVISEGKKQPFALYDGQALYVSTDDTLYRKMDVIGRFPYVRQTTKVHYEGRWVTVNKSPIWQDEHDEVQSWISFVNRKGKLEGMGFESIRELLKGNHDLIVDFDKEKWNEQVFLKYLTKMNERYTFK